ncbi:MAG: NUDIX hydrolase [Candidatus Woesearchaeota archaeon]
MNGLARPKVTVLGAVLFNNEILLIERNENPFKGQWGLIGGKLENLETLKQGILREVKEETNLNVNFIKFNCVDHIILNKSKKSYIGFFSTLKANNKNFKESDEGKLCWFKLNDLPKNMIKADKYLIENYLDKEIKIPEMIYDEDNFKII